MSEIETLLRQHTDSVGDALEGFEGQVTSVRELVSALQTQVTALNNRPVRAAAARGYSPDEGRTAATPSVAMEDGLSRQPQVMNLRFPNEERQIMAAIMRGTDTRSMQIASDTDGGFIVPDVIRSQIEARVLRQSPIRRVARVVDFQSGRTVLPINARGTTAGWVGENEERTETETPALEALAPPGGTVYALPRATEELIDDAIVNLEQFIEENVVDALAEKESQAFIYGDGIRKPAGFLSGTIIDASDASRPRRAIQSVGLGLIDGRFAEALLLPAIVSLIFSMKGGYRQAPGTAFMASTDFISQLARMHDGDGRPLYVPSLREDVPGMLLGYPVIEAEHMPAAVPGAFPLAFANWQRGYVIGDRTQLNVLRDPYTTKGQVKWYFRKRVHGAVLNTEAIKVLKALQA